MKNLLCLFVIGLAASAAAANDPPPPLSIPPDPPPLVQRVTSLEKRVAELEKQVANPPPVRARELEPTPPYQGKDPGAISQCNCRPAPGGVGTCKRYECPANGDAPGLCPCQTVVFPQAASGTRLTIDPPPVVYRTVPPVGVAAPAPFVPSPVPAQSTILITPVTGAAGSLQYGLTGSGVGGTPTGVRVGTSGITSGCANGACAAPARGLFFRR